MEHEHYPDPHHSTYSKTVFGFWIYLLTDFILFATLFAAYVVLRKSTFGGPSSRELFHLNFTFAQTLILLTCSFTVGIAGASAHRKNVRLTVLFFALTFLLGLIFIGMEFHEFSRLINEGNNWKESAFLSMYFTVVGTHGIHMLFAMLWTIVLIVPVFLYGLIPVSIQRLTCLRMFWQFLNIVWVFIFSIIYLLGGIKI